MAKVLGEAGSFNAYCLFQLTCISNHHLSLCFHRKTGAGRRLVGHFDHSQLVKDALKKQQEYQDAKPEVAKTFIQDCPTRWNSAYLMMHLDLRVPVYAVLSEDYVTHPSDHAKLDICDGFWKTIEMVVPFLEPFAEVSEMLGMEDLPTGSSVYPLLVKLINADLVIDDEEATVGNPVKLALLDGIKKRFNVTSSCTILEESLDSPLLKTVALDQRYKSLRFLSQEHNLCISHVHNLYLAEMKDLGNAHDGVEACSEPP